MSYIRTGSNPEGLYIWGDEKTVHISRKKGKNVTVPEPVFISFIEEYWKTFKYRGVPDSLTFNGLTVSEVFIKGDPKIELSYGNHWTIYMWYSTWYYLMANNRLRKLTPTQRMWLEKNGLEWKH